MVVVGRCVRLGVREVGRCVRLGVREVGGA